MPDKEKKLWDYIQQDRNRFLQLNEEGKKTYLNYGYRNGLLKQDELTDKSMSYIDKSVAPKATTDAFKSTKSIMSNPTINKNDRQKKEISRLQIQGKPHDSSVSVPMNPIAPFGVNALNTATFGLFERNSNVIDDLREGHPIQSTLGSMVGYAVPFSGAKSALVKGTQTVGKRILTDALIGAGIDATTEAVKGKNDLKTAAKNVAAGAAIGVIADGALEGIGRFAKYVGGLKKIPAEEITSTVDDIAKSTTINSTGRFKVKNTALEKAINEYNSAIDAIQNHFGTNELRSEEMARIKTELGIDLDGIVRKLEDAEKGISVSDIGAKRNLANAAGVKDLPSLKFAKSAQKTASNINTSPIENKVLKSALNASDEAAVSADLASDSTYKELTEELQGVNIAPDDTIKSIATNIKDKSGLTLNLKDVYRNMRDAFGSSYGYVKKNYLDPFDASKKAYTDEVKTYTDDIYNKVVKGLGINKGTKESAAVQNFGEGLITKEQLVKEFGDEKAKSIIEADKIFRKTYDELIDKVNATRAQIYPNNPDKIVPKRQDYYRHFVEMAEGFQGLKNIFETPAAIDPKLAGMSEFTKPKSRWASFMQHRGDGDYTADAVGGFLNYIQPAAYSIHIDPHVSRFRGLAKDIAEATQKTKNANSTIKYLSDFANSLAGKTSKYDRVLKEDIPGGRMAFNAINWLNSRVKANQVLMNAQSAISQFANVPVGMARIKNPVAITKGAGQTLAGIVGKGNKAIKDSQFINERYMSSLISRFDKKLTQQPKKFAAWLLEGADKLGTTFTWNSAYNKAVAQGIENPVKYADDFARGIAAGRGIGEVPLLQQSKLFQVVAPFQLEVSNLWQVFGDAIKEKDFAAIALILIGNTIFNDAVENTTGNRPVFDPVDAMLDELIEDNPGVLRIGKNLLTKGELPRLNQETSAGKIAGRLAGEALSNVPLGQTAAAMYPEYGADISTPMGSVSLPSRRELFGDNDPTRFGGGLLVTKALSDPLYKIAAPFGGAQAKKTIEGLKSVSEGMVAKNGKMSFPVDKNLENYAKSALFGKYATDEAREYFDKDRRPLSEKQTADIQKKKNIKSAYEKLMDERRINTLNDKIKDIKMDKTISQAEKKEKISKLQTEISNIRKGM